MSFVHGTSSSYRKCRDGPDGGPCDACIESRREADAIRQARKRQRDKKPAHAAEPTRTPAGRRRTFAPSQRDHLDHPREPVDARREDSARALTVTPAVTPAVTPPAAPSESLIVRGARQAGILPDRIQQSSKSKSIALPSMSRPAIGSAGKSESHIIQDCAEGNHPWKMTDPETGLAECARSPECSAIRQDTEIRPADTLRRFLYHNTLSSNNPRMSRNPSLRGDKATYLNKKCPRNICSDAPGIKCPH